MPSFSRSTSPKPRIPDQKHLLRLPTIYPNDRRNCRRFKAQGYYPPESGNWDIPHDDGAAHVFAKYTMEADDSTLISVTNEGWIRKFENKLNTDGNKSAEEMQNLEWYARTNPRLNSPLVLTASRTGQCLLGSFHRPSQPNHVTIDANGRGNATCA